MNARTIGKDIESKAAGAKTPSRETKPTPTEVHRYEFAAKKTLGLFTGAALRLAIIILVAIFLFILIIYFVSA